MLGVRLDGDIDRRLTALADRQQRIKSDIASEALVSYLQREDESMEFQRQVRAIAEWKSQNGDDGLDEFLDALVHEALDDDDLADESCLRPAM